MYCNIFFPVQAKNEFCAVRGGFIKAAVLCMGRILCFGAACSSWKWSDSVVKSRDQSLIEMSVGGILQNSLSQPSHYLDMKLHRWGFISPGSHCLLMIIQDGGNLHAVMLLTIFLSSSLHLLYIICEGFFFLL